MPNAAEIPFNPFEKVLFVGGNGSGKSMQALTMPGKHFWYIFETSGRQVVQGYEHIWFEEFLPEKLNLQFYGIQKKDSVGRADQIALAKTSIKPMAFSNWEAHWIESLNNGFFEQFDTVVFDSLSSFQAIAMDDILFREDAANVPPELGHRNILKVALMNMIRSAASLSCHVVMTAHLDYKQDEVTKGMLNLINLVGTVKIDAPGCFSSVFGCESECTPAEDKWTVQTRKDKKTLYARPSRLLSGLKFNHDVTIKDFKKPWNYGIGYELTKAIKNRSKS